MVALLLVFWAGTNTWKDSFKLGFFYYGINSPRPRFYVCLLELVDWYSYATDILKIVDTFGLKKAIGVGHRYRFLLVSMQRHRIYVSLPRLTNVVFSVLVGSFSHYSFGASAL